MGHPTVYPTGVTAYNKDAAWNGWTVFSSVKGTILIDMNGREAHRWEGNTIHRFEGGASFAENLGGEGRLLLVHHEVRDEAVSAKTLLDSSIIEVDEAGKIIWEWHTHEHFDELGFDEEAKYGIYRLLLNDTAQDGGDWLGMNSIAALGPNPRFDGGDERFHPDNILWSARNANILAVISKKTGKLVWRLGPDFRDVPFGPLIGPSHFHLIPEGLPGAGNFLVFDNGGWAGYGLSRYGAANLCRDYSRILEFNGVSLELVWQYSPVEAGHIHPLDSYKLYSPFFGAAQRLPNGNTLITEGKNGRIFEVTPEHKTVWEYVNPYGAALQNGWENPVYHARRFPYQWASQLDAPEEVPVYPRNISRLRIKGAPLGPGGKITKIEGISLDADKLVDNPLEAVISIGDGVGNFCVLNSGERK